MLKLLSAVLMLAAASAAVAREGRSGEPGTYAVGQVVNAHTLMVCNSKEHMLEVAEAYKLGDAAGEERWAQLEKAKTVLGDAACGRIDGSNMVKIMEMPILVETIGSGADRERMTVVRMQVTGGGRTVWAMLLGDYEISERGAAGRGPSGPVEAGSVARAIGALTTKAGSDRWDDEVKDLLLRAFDKDRSGSIDTESEVKAIPCEVWRTMHNRIHAADSGSGLAWTYGIKPGDYDWVGDALGIVEKLRPATYQRLRACGVDTGA